MNIDMAFDYDRLLAQAKAEYAKVLESGDALRTSYGRPDEGDNAEKFKQAVASWRAWCRKNVERRGVRLARDTANRDAPVGIVAVISGHG